MRPAEKTMAFGGVAMGSIHAALHEIMAGRHTAMGSLSALTAAAMSVGARIVAVAVLDATSVRFATTKTINSIKIYGVNSIHPAILPPSQSEVPDSWTALEIANPAPIMRMMSHAMCFSMAFDKMASPGRWDDGMRNRGNAQNMATVPSLK